LQRDHAISAIIEIRDPVMRGFPEPFEPLIAVVCELGDCGSPGYVRQAERRCFCAILPPTRVLRGAARGEGIPREG
jgi:hypothetical protein